jgi:chromosome segregation ATPase
VSDHDAVKRELQSVRGRLEEEQKARKSLEQELDDHSEKVRMIANSMDSVEREFVNRDENIASLRQRVEAERTKTDRLEKELKAAKDIILAMHDDMERGSEQQNVLLKQFQDAETEATEMQEFLQAEKTALAETIKDNEQEMACYKAQLLTKDEEVATVEERCSHLVRIGEQRHQEVMALQAQLTGVQDRAKDMLLAQGAEITRANVQIDELCSSLERILGEEETARVLSNGKATKGLEATAPTTNGDSHAVKESREEEPPPYVGPSTAQFHVSESLQNLSRAISQRERLENGELSLSSSTSSSSMPSLADRIKDVSQLVERIMQKEESGSNNT